MWELEHLRKCNLGNKLNEQYSEKLKKLSFWFLPGVSGKLNIEQNKKSKFNKDVFPTASLNIVIERGVELSGKLCSFIQRKLLRNENEEFFSRFCKMGPYI